MLLRVFVSLVCSLSLVHSMACDRKRAGPERREPMGRVELSEETERIAGGDRPKKGPEKPLSRPSAAPRPPRPPLDDLSESPTAEEENRIRKSVLPHLDEAE